MNTLSVFFGIESEEETKICNKCSRNLPISFYGRDSGAKKLSSSCKECSKKHGNIAKELKKIIPPPPDDHICFICERTSDQIKNDLRYRNRKNIPVWSLDHDHVTGKFRGYICNKCNMALGNFNDDLKRIERALIYLKRTNDG